jgi:hypothetical protein
MQAPHADQTCDDLDAAETIAKQSVPDQAPGARQYRRIQTSSDLFGTGDSLRRQTAPGDAVWLSDALVRAGPI